MVTFLQPLHLLSVEAEPALSRAVRMRPPWPPLAPRRGPRVGTWRAGGAVMVAVGKLSPPLLCPMSPGLQAAPGCHGAWEMGPQSGCDGSLGPREPVPHPLSLGHGLRAAGSWALALALTSQCFTQDITWSPDSPRM